MFWKESVRFCKSCKHYRTKDWSAWNYECKLGKKTPSGGHTTACDRYEQQSSFTGGNYCKNCARWEEGFLSGRCIKGYPAPKGRDSDACKYFVKG